MIVETSEQDDGGALPVGERRTTIAIALRRLQGLANPSDAVFLQRFFRTAPGEYGEGDRFLGIRVPALRKLVAQLGGELSVVDGVEMLDSVWHETRLFALLVLVRGYSRGDAKTQAEIYRHYLRSTHRINNWDLVDASAEHIVGAHLLERSRAPLARLARSSLLWDRRIAIVSTYHFIKRGEYASTLDLAGRLLRDEHDLMHKATGWMLREVGKRDVRTLEGFLERHAHEMPRTMLRYSLEKFPAKRRAYWMSRKS